MYNDDWYSREAQPQAKTDAIVASQTATTGGRKFDGNKLEYGLIPPLAMQGSHLWRSKI
jgi:hypothetical protein